MISEPQVEADRFSRFRLIRWWDQQKISAAKVLVVGAGALGNEILKNLALLGFCRMVVVDCDRIEQSNLSRSVLYRPSDVGTAKATAAARSIREIFQGATVQPLDVDILQQAGSGLFDWADLILAGVDNRETRLWINRQAWKFGKPWIDGAIEGLNGLARVFVSGTPPCYECTLGEVDWAILEHRLSCNLLARAEREGGKVPTTPTVSSVIGGIQVQEAVKLLHGLPTLAGKGYLFEGLNHTSYVFEYTENRECLSHHRLETVVRLGRCSSATTLGELHEIACRDLASEEVVLDFSRDVIERLVCPECAAEEEVFAPVGAVPYEAGRCPHDGAMRSVLTTHSYDGGGRLKDRTLDRLGLPLFDLFSARSGEREIGYVMWGDAGLVLAGLAS